VNDSIWHAAALEGQASSLVALEYEKDAPSYLDAVVEMYEESLATMSKVAYASVLSIEASFKLARYLMRWSKKCEAADVLMRMYEFKMDCSAHDQIALAVEAAILCHQLGFKRKFGFFLVQAAGLYRELHQSASCHALLRMATPVFRLDGFSKSVIDADFMAEPELVDHAAEERELAAWEQSMDGASNSNPMAYFDRIRHMHPAKRHERGYRVGRWVLIQKSILEHLIFSAKQMQEDQLTATCTADLLRTLYPWLDDAYQSSIVSDLWSCTNLLPLNIRTIDMTGLPVLHSLRPLELPSEVAPWMDPNPLDEEMTDTTMHADVHDTDSASTSMGSCARLRRAEAAASGDVFLSRPDEDQSKLPARKVSHQQALASCRIE
jgi:hypothetical protein